MGYKKILHLSKWKDVIPSIYPSGFDHLTFKLMLQAQMYSKFVTPAHIHSTISQVKSTGLTFQNQYF